MTYGASLYMKGATMTLDSGHKTGNRSEPDLCMLILCSLIYCWRKARQRTNLSISLSLWLSGHFLWTVKGVDLEDKKQIDVLRAGEIFFFFFFSFYPVLFLTLLRRNINLIWWIDRLSKSVIYFNGQKYCNSFFTMLKSLLWLIGIHQPEMSWSLLSGKCISLPSLAVRKKMSISGNSRLLITP